MLSRLVIVLVRFYQAAFSGALGGRCRFYPSCSEYAIQAIEEHGVLRGSSLAVRRFVRCAPWGRGGIDQPPPPAGISRGQA